MSTWYMLPVSGVIFWHPCPRVVCTELTCPTIFASLTWSSPETYSYTGTHTTTILRPFFWDHPGEPVPDENLWTLWCKGRLTEANTPTTRLGATPSGLTIAHLHHPPIFYRPDALPAAQPTVSKHWRQLIHMQVQSIHIHGIITIMLSAIYSTHGMHYWIESNSMWSMNKLKLFFLESNITSYRPLCDKNSW